MYNDVQKYGIFYVLIAAFLKVQFFWYITPCRLVNSDGVFVLNVKKSGTEADVVSHSKRFEFLYSKFGRFGQQIRNTRKVLKCGAGDGWRRSVGPIM